MTDEEKGRLRREKERVTSALMEADVRFYGLWEVDERIYEYVREVCGNPEGHNLWEQLAVERFLKLCRRYGLSRGHVRRFFTFYEGLYFPGKGGQQRYRLTPVQAFQFASIYGFRHEGRRVVKEAVLFVPRKFSKTTSSAAFAIYDLLFGDANAESYTGANSADQAKKCFDVIRQCMRKLDPGERRYTVNEQMIKSRRKDRQAFAQCLTANARTKDGLNASTVIMDEFSQAKDADLLTVLTTSMGVRDEPLTVIITTASDVFDGPFYEMLQGYRQVLLGEIEDDSLFVHLFEPDVDDAEDDPATWRKVHPHLGVTVSEEFYRREYTKALRNGAETMLAFRTKLLNVYAENELKSWISSTLARKQSRPMPLDGFKGKPEAMVAIDLSESEDFSAISVGIYDKDLKGFHYRTDYFFPRGAVSGHVNERLYRTWAEAGHLTLTEGDVIDYRAIVDHVLKLSRYFNIRGIGYDGWHSQECINMIGTAGKNFHVLTAVKQSYGNFSAPVESFEHGIKTGRIFINDNPINWYCFGNAVLDVDKLENFKPVKRKQSQKIDGVITMLMAHRLFIDSAR